MASETEPLVSAPRRAGRVAPALVSLLVVAALAAAAASTRSSAAPVAWRAVDAATRFGALDDGALAVASFEVVDTHEPNEHKRVAVATLRRAEIARFPGGGARLAVRYAPSGGSSSALAPLWSRAVRVAADEGEDALLRVEIPLLRLRAAHQYAAELFVSFGDGDDEGGGAARRRATTRFATADVTHCTALSNGAVASVTSGFSYEVLVVPWVEASSRRYAAGAVPPAGPSATRSNTIVAWWREAEGWSSGTSTRSGASRPNVSRAAPERSRRPSESSPRITSK